jgi:hypothetical protein
MGSLVRGGSTVDGAALDRPRVRSSRGAPVPGRTRDRAPAEEAGSGKTKPWTQFCTAATAGKAGFPRNPLVGRSYHDFGPRGSCPLALSCRWRFAEGWTWKRRVTSCDSPEGTPNAIYRVWEPNRLLSACWHRGDRHSVPESDRPVSAGMCPRRQEACPLLGLLIGSRYVWRPQNPKIHPQNPSPRSLGRGLTACVALQWSGRRPCFMFVAWKFDSHGPSNRTQSRHGFSIAAHAAGFKGLTAA